MRCIEKEASPSAGVVVSFKEVCCRAVARGGRGGRRLFSHRRSLSHDSRAANCESDRMGSGSAIVEIVCAEVLALDVLFAYKCISRMEPIYRINMTMSPLYALQALRPVISM